MTDITNCLWCRGELPATAIRTADFMELKCSICGPYLVPGGCVYTNDHDFFDVKQEDRYLIAAWVRRKYRSGEKPLITKNDAKNIVANAPRLEPGEKAQALLRVMGEISKRPGAGGSKDDLQFPDAYAEDDDELHAYIDWLEGSSFIVHSAVILSNNSKRLE